MEVRTISAFGKAAGLAGVALGVLLYIFQGVLEFVGRQSGLGPAEAFIAVQSLLILTFGVAAFGLVVWLLDRGRGGRPLTNTTLAIMCLLLFAILGAAIVFPIVLRPQTVVLAPSVAAPEPKPVPMSSSVYKVCVGELPERCPSGSVVLGCGSSIEVWAQQSCKAAQIKRISDTQGNRCGYYVAEVTCLNPAAG